MVISKIFTGLFLLLILPSTARAQIVFLPECGVNLPVSDPFCQSQCQNFDPPPEFCPAPATREPILIIPGIAASHNKERILKDEVGGEWKFAPTVDWFDALIERLETEGYEQGKDLFIVHYDWRQSNEHSAIEYLVPAITHAKQESGAAKVDIIAHSMGGLVARAYAQSELFYNDDIDQLVILGTPNNGAADAYVLWEGGRFPERWSSGSRYWINRIERSLKKVRDQDLKRPISYRTFFPSLRDLLPTMDFVTRNNAPLATNQLSEQNTFLKTLNETKDILIERGIEVTTIAGTNLNTLDKVALNPTRTQEDQTLQRWRDGHANPDPPLPDSNDGDQTVLTSSVHALGGTQHALANTSHEELPAKAQNHIVATLVPEPVGDFIPSHLATAALGVDVLSPVLPTIKGPNGYILSATQNTFPTDSEVNFDYDPSNPNDIKMVTILNPPPGDYTVELIGTGTGDYTVITSYADEDETIMSEREGTTTTGQQESFAIAVTDTSFVAPATDLHALVTELRDLVNALHHNKSLKKASLGKLHGITTSMYNHSRQYQQAVEKSGAADKKAQHKYESVQQDFQRFSAELDNHLPSPALNQAIREQLLNLRQALIEYGL